ncbi:uncharacterized protein EDB93DRAFT_1240307 [Suillus bovinus]|uniref:uncharacterized protein n=1 Tax=Suillus bovinus TaxID=48563 RepID=UPI001B8625CD|nr:uncharacterized protein EDB93DRAFT_1240307 [Suillus bovinus]KAG2150281.1 hypothetical protein EDB93DRAFT_1240307 [Suillus bovinus]
MTHTDDQLRNATVYAVGHCIALDHHVYKIGGGRELFDKLEALLLEGDKIIAMPIAALEDEIGMQDDDYFGIELLDKIPVDSSMKTKANMKVNLGGAYYPWLSRAHFLTALLFSPAQLPFLDVQKKAVLSWAKELRAHDESNEHICELVSNPMRKVTSASGNDYTNLLTHFSMQDYPEDGGDGMSQVFTWTEDAARAAITSGGLCGQQIYFVNELLQECSGGFLSQNASSLPCMHSEWQGLTGFVPGGDKTYAMGHAIQYTDAGFIVSDEQEIIPVSNFRHSFEDLVDKLTCGVTMSSEKYLKLTPHPLCKKSKGQMVYSVPLIIFMDDISGNMLEKEFCVRFITSSPHAAPMELMHVMKESISAAADSGIFAWDCKFDEEVMLIPEGLFLAGDNLMQAKECSHAGLNCNYFCRTCHSEAGYVSLFTEGTPQTPEEMTSQVLKQFETALCSGATGKVAATISTTGIRDSTSSSIINTLPALPESEVRAKLEEELSGILQDMNVHMDTPTEILHTVLLSVVKYFWGQTVFVLKKAKLLTRFQTRLNSLDRDDLNVPSLNADYICHYKGGLIGKHFKSLVQVMPFVIYDPIPKSVLDGWTLIGELVLIHWHMKIDNTEHYLAKLARTISNFLNVTAHCLIMYSVLHAFTTIDKLQTHIGHIREILIATAPGHSVAFVALQTFSFMPARHPLLHLPCLLLTDEELIVSGMDIICIANHLSSLLPESLSETPLHISDPGAGKRLVKKLGGEAVSVPQDDDGVHPAFDCAAKKQPKTTSRKQSVFISNPPCSTHSSTRIIPCILQPSKLTHISYILIISPNLMTLLVNIFTSRPPKMMLNHFPLHSISGGSQRANSIGPPGMPTSSGSQSQSSNPLPDTSIVLTSPSRPGSPSGSSDLNAPISTGVRHQRDSSTNAACLTPRCTKAGQLEREEEIEINTLQELEKLLTSRDFESALKSHLTACMLSPNLTAYITDTHQHVMVVRIYFLLP